MTLSWKNSLKLFPLLLACAAYSGLAFAAAGSVQFVIGDVKRIDRAGVAHPLAKGAEINEGDRIVTGPESSAQIKMIDGGFIAVRQNTDMGFDTYRYGGKEDGKESALVSLVSGGFRTITGLIGRTNKQNYMIKTDTATIGIRGTDHEPMVILAPAPGRPAVAAAGTYDKVNVGIAYIRTDAGSIDIHRNQVGFAPVTKAAPVILPRIPPFYKPTPAPGVQRGKDETKEKETTPQQAAAKAVDDQKAQATSQTRNATATDTTATAPAAPTVTTTTTTAPALATPTTTAPTTTRPVVAVTATSATGTTVNVTTQTQTTTTGSTAPITTTPTSPVNFSSTAALRSEIIWPTTQVASSTSPITTYVVSDKNKQNLFFNSTGTPNTPLTTALTTPVTLNGPTASSNFVFDANGNLTQVASTPHVIFDHGNDVPGSATQFATPTPLATAKLALGSGGTAAEAYYSAATGVAFGRWSGGTVTVTDLSTGASGTNYVESLVAPGGAARSMQWVVAQTPSSLPVTGLYQYTRIAGASGAPGFATAPTDSYGNVGTFEGARVSADFTNMTASAGVRISMPSGPNGSFGVQNLSSQFANAPITNGGFNVSSGTDNPTGTDFLHVGCFGAGCATGQSYGGRIRGGFTSATGNAGTADGAFFRYTFNTNYEGAGVAAPTGRVVDDYINGMVAFQQGPQVAIPTSAAYPTAAPTAPVVVVTNYAFSSGAAGITFTGGQHYWIDKPQTGLVTDSAGNLISVTEPNSAQHGDGNALALSGGTAATPKSLAIGSTASATDGSILLGWQGTSPALTVTGTDFNGCFGTSGCSSPARTVLGDGLSWVRGPAPFPDYLPGAIAGLSQTVGASTIPIINATGTYALGSSILHDQTGTAGTVSSASLSVNFNAASVNFSMAATTSAGNWTANASGIRMNSDGAFNASPSTTTTLASGTSIVPTSLHNSLSVVLAPTTGTVSNTFGNVNGQLMGIGLSGAGVTFDLNALLCISSCNNVTASGALGFSNASPYSTQTAYQLVAFASGMNAAGQIDPKENYRINGGFVSPYRTQTVNGFPVKLDGELPVVSTFGSPCTVNCGPFTNTISAVYAVAGATTGPGTGAPVASIGTATLLESGVDSFTGIRWGRWGGGTVGVTDRISGASLGTIDVTQQNVHFIATQAQSGPTVLPVTGTFSYTFVGGTSPTDSKGNVGSPITAANASLTANFTARTVDASLSNLSAGGNTWSASATGMPISGTIFQAEKKLGGTGNLSITSSLGTNTSGTIAGGFTGQAGNGVGMLYSLNHGGNIATNPAAVTISGVAVFKR